MIVSIRFPHAHGGTDPELRDTFVRECASEPITKKHVGWHGMACPTDVICIRNLSCTRYVYRILVYSALVKAYHTDIVSFRIILSCGDLRVRPRLIVLSQPILA